MNMIAVLIIVKIGVIHVVKTILNDDSFRENYGRRQRNYDKNRERVDEHRKQDYVQDNSTRNGRYQEENWNTMRSFDSSQRNREDEGTSQHVLKAENTIRDCDWSTSELGIKMAIQYLKNKDEVTKSEKQGSNTKLPKL